MIFPPYSYNQKFIDCRAVILLASQRCGVMAPVIGVLERKDTSSLGRMSRGEEESEEGVLPFMSVTSWSQWRSAWGWMRSC